MGMQNLEEGRARLHEELGQREKALRDTRIRNIHEVERWKGAQEMRMDEFSRNEIERKSRCDTGGHFTDTGVAERMNYMK